MSSLSGSFTNWICGEHVTLQNETHIPYRKLGIPCCPQCNQEHLSAFENRVKSASMHGRAGLLALDEMTLFLWVAKMMYGLVHKELLLNRDIRDPLAGSIVSQGDLGPYTTLHGFLQSARAKGNIWEGAPPCSVFVYRVDPSPERDLRFWFRDSPAVMCFAIHMNDVGLVAALLDGGMTKWYLREMYHDIGDQALKPQQFEEIAAFTFYIRSLQKNVPRYRTLQPNPSEPTILVVQEPPDRLTLEAPYREWNTRDYAQLLGHFMKRWGINPNRMMQPGGTTYTCVFDQEGKLDLSRKRAQESYRPEDFAHVYLNAPNDSAASRVVLG